MPAAITAAPTPTAPHLVRVGTVTIPAQPGQPDMETINAAPAVLPLAAPESAPAATPGAPETLVRVERGTATAEEIAAVTAVLLARAAAVRAAADAGQASASRRRAAARWRSHGFAGPRAWTTGTRDLLAS
ncbi:Acyl-CoA carboxylase epsilon subunit [Actinacidiphila alni]|uniref:Acyl-CoA carboxylase epsilon subunit n=1 Tax=Actinacidiphila alni TaxID=380248 RepID=A0A1I2B5Z5_9ACTN|nr:Acyl-CoA carboxylase epsilon subunit [Actinacidiphila alni]